MSPLSQLAQSLPTIQLEPTKQYHVRGVCVRFMLLCKESNVFRITCENCKIGTCHVLCSNEQRRYSIRRSLLVDLYSTHIRHTSSSLLHDCCMWCTCSMKLLVLDKYDQDVVACFCLMRNRGPELSFVSIYDFVNRSSYVLIYSFICSHHTLRCLEIVSLFEMFRERC